MFEEAVSFNGDIWRWHVSSVTSMSNMFRGAKSFNRDISNWDVSSVTNMNRMFYDASAFEQKLCGAAWVHSQASQTKMFVGSSGSIARAVCTTATTIATRRRVCRPESSRPSPVTRRSPMASPSQLSSSLSSTTGRARRCQRTCARGTAPCARPSPSEAPSPSTSRAPAPSGGCTTPTRRTSRALRRAGRGARRPPCPMAHRRRS